MESNNNFKMYKQDEIIRLLLLVNQKLDSNMPIPLYKDWIPRKMVLKFMGYSASQLRLYEREGELITSKVGRRIFYSAKSIKNLIEKNANYAKQ
jgi:DNA-binding transcriptional MerR regulator